MDELLFRKIDLPSDEPVQFVGCYVLNWGEVASKPTVAFVEVDEECVSKEKIRKIMIDIQAEINENPQYANIGKKGCYRRLSELL